MDPSPVVSLLSLDRGRREATDLIEEGNEPIVVVEQRKHEPRPTTRLWNMFGRRVPRSEIVFFCQTVIIYIVVVTSLVNITLQNGPVNLWIALLGSGLGYLLPHPSIDKSETRHRDVSYSA